MEEWTTREGRIIQGTARTPMSFNSVSSKFTSEIAN